MAQKLYEEANIQDIANAIRAKNGTTTTYKTNEMAAAIRNIETGGGGTSDELVKQLVQTRGGILTIPSDIGITAIGKHAFAYSSYNEIYLPEGVTEIHISAFYDSSIIKIGLPQSITKIATYAFGFCEYLRSITFPQNLETIGSSAFSGCKWLTSVTFKGTPVKIDSTAFTNCNRLTTINVPWAEGEVANAPWGANNATINYNYTE